MRVRLLSLKFWCQQITNPDLRLDRSILPPLLPAYFHRNEINTNF
jgi:hypothetical protein